MKQKIFLLFIFIILFNIAFSLNANEKSVNPVQDKSDLLFNFSNNSDNIINFKSSNMDYTKKRKGMFAVGGIGVGLMVSGFIMEVGGSFAYLYILLAREPMFEDLADNYGIDTVPASWYRDKYIALAIAGAGSLLFLGGLAMTIVGFALAKYYKNKVDNNKVSLNTFTEFENGIFETGFVLRL